ncbi:MAG: hypothetical protein MUF39_03770 [Cyclobacteriaceae bacterium]|nr:hypothetical protein [Cyclobacteriaceae bacterium]
MDSIDAHPESIKEDLTINDQESIIEIVVEDVLGYENAIKEYDEHDSEEQNKGNTSKQSFTIYFSGLFNPTPTVVIKRKQPHSEYETQITNGFHQLATPPPKI